MNKRHLLTGFMFLLCTYTAFAQQVEVKKDSIGRAVHDASYISSRIY